jgi:O-antigen/teichoic acid export membrane protein
VLAAEGVAGLLGFAALAHLARRLAPSSFASVEYASAVSAWLLVLVRGGMDVIAYREAARRPRLIAPWTEVLLGLRLLAACAGYAVVLAVAALVGPERVGAVAVVGLLLFAAAVAADVGPRASGRLGWIALATAVRALGYLGSVVIFVRGPGQALRASACLVAAEALGAAVALAVHFRDHGPIRPRWRRSASAALARRGAVAGLTRFGRVTLYGLDLLILGGWAASDLAPYAASRRVVFALLALGLAVPATLGPSIGRAWASGPVEARRRVGRAMDGLWLVGLPASVGLILTADRAMPWLFGEGYRGGGPWLALTAARLPCLLSSGVAQTALVACRREGGCLRLVAAQMALAVALLTAAAVGFGPWGIGWAALVVEAAGAVAGWVFLGGLGVAARGGLPTARVVVGCLALAVSCLLTRDAPFPVAFVAGAAAYGAVVALAAGVVPPLGSRRGYIGARLRVAGAKRSVPRGRGLGIPGHAALGPGHPETAFETGRRDTKTGYGS